MGVFGLETFMERNSITSQVNIGSLAQNFMKSNRKPILLIDFPSCFGHIYRNASLDKICGGQNKELVDVFKQLLKNFKTYGIKYVFFCDGYPPEERLEIWLQRRIRKIDTTIKTMSGMDATDDAAELKKLQDEFNIRSFPATGAWFAAMNYLRSINAELIQTIREADEEIISYFKRQRCFGVLAQDSDFVIADGIPHSFSIKHLNIHTLDTVEYSRDKLARKLSLRSDLLPIFATLCGNDHVFVDKLRSFHAYLLRIRNAKYFPPNKLFPKIAEWINMQSRSVDLNRYPKEVAVMIGLPELSGKFAASVESYLSGAVTFPPPALSSHGTWGAIVAEANAKMRCQHQCSKINSVIVSQVLFSSIYLQYFLNDLYPSDEKVGATLRRKFYGILLKQHLKSYSIKVTEYVSSGKMGSQSVAPIFPGNHPGLLSMWSNQGNLQEEKWQLLGWAVGEGVPLNLVRALPEPLQIPTLALFYITHESRILQQWQASALALQAVLLLQATPFELQKIQCICQDGVAVHLATVYQSMCMWVSYVAEACGNPTCLFKFNDYAMFDGKLFHSIYMSFKRLGNFGTYLKKLNADESQFLQQMQTVIRR